MSGSPQAITIIIPTTAAPHRRDYLRRAVQSVLSQADVDISALIVANGPRCDEAILEEMSALNGVRLLRVEEPSMPRALEIGRAHVETPYFGELDDDDVMLQLGARRLLDALVGDPAADVVVANCIVHREGSDEILSMPDLESVRRNPLEALMTSNWLGPGVALFRTETVPPNVFSAIPKYLEWTYLGIVLCLHYRLLFLDVPVSIHYKGLAHSVDLSREARLGRANTIAEILTLPVPANVRQCLRERQGAALHDSAMQHLADGNLGLAWSCHVRSLWHPKGWRYITFTRHLFWPKPAYDAV